MSAIGVLVMAYGGPNTLDEVEPYLLDVRGGRPTPAHLVEEVRERYRKIGGRSPIAERTAAQADALRRVLASNGDGFRVTVGMRHWQPKVAQALAGLREQGVERAVGLVLAPHFSKLSIGAYWDAVEQAGSGIEVARIDSWHLVPGYVEALAANVRGALLRFRESERAGIPVVFTAHSLPQRIAQWSDPYAEQLRATMDAVVARLGDHPHRFAFQSAGMSPEPWLGPDVGDVVAELAAGGSAGAVIAPIGFVSDHVEILYDIDIELMARARELGIRLERTRMLNDDPLMIAGLAGVVRERARAAGWM